MALPSFASEEQRSYLPIKTADISFQVIKENLSLERILALNRQELTINFLNLMKADHLSLQAMTYSDKGLSEKKKEMIVFLLLEVSMQKKILLDERQNLIEKWIDGEIQFEDVFDFITKYGDLQSLGSLDQKETLVSMPHFFLSLADRDIIKKVFQTEGFNPYSRTALGHNLLHSFLSLGWMRKNLYRDITESSYNKALKLLIKLSPPELLTQKNDLGLTPLAFAVVLGDFSSYQLLIKSMKAEDIIKEFPSLEREILNRGAYQFLNAINEVRIKFNELDNLITVSEGGWVLAALGNERDSIGSASFMNAERDHFPSRFHFPSLAYQSRTSDFVKSIFQKAQLYENDRMIRLARIFKESEWEELREIVKAVFDRDIKALRQNFKAQTENYDVLDLAQTILEESIRNQFEEGVLFSIQIMEDNVTAFFYDTMLLALLSYVSLNEKHPRKEIAKKIIRIVDSARDNERREFLESSVFWSVFFNIPDELEYFMKARKEIVVTLEVEWLGHLMDHARDQGYPEIYNYLLSQLKEHPEVISVSCQSIFIH